MPASENVDGVSGDLDNQVLTSSEVVDSEADEAEYDDFEGDPLEVLCTYLSMTIHLGTPIYNCGDHRGCYEIYASTARMLIRMLEGADEALDVLRESLQEAALEPDVTEQAWILRRSFDAILEAVETQDEPN